ncbi:hypothetical protein GOQ29_05935 [Clostridium sp. D2Q-14]|uniref:hypothetical protein n=1 Tax=Anaeromonas gelatinilytica TaxID=2683194 RepID=UPI00193B6A2C|nr:hypothetical protein [Anaeromonas gelatinilytica]MBS4535159.1 hypothetical protein [Anaeromonas gelatinilytica]
MSNIKYLRKFIILEPTESTIKTKGYSKIEIRDGRGKLEVNLDGISDMNKGYDVFLLTEEGVKSNVAKFGTIYDAGNGKTSMKRDFDPKNVLHSDKSIDDYNIIAVKNLEEEILYGYIHNEDKDKDIKSLLTEKNKKEEIKFEEERIQEKQIQEESQEARIQEKPEEEKVDIEIKEKIEEYEEDIEEDIKTEKESEENYDDELNVEDEIKNENKELGNEIEINNVKVEIEENNEEEQIEHQNINEENEVVGIKKDYPIADDNIEDYYLDESHKKLEEYQEYKERNFKQRSNNNYYSMNGNIEKNNKNPMDAYSLNILNYFNEVEAFKIKLKGYRTWEITEDSVNIRRGFLPYYNYVVNMHYPYSIMNRMTSASMQIRKYRHYLFGIVSDNDKDIKQFVYGIPGKFSRKEQPYRGMSGFTTWLEKADSDKDNKLGYWLIHIDAKTGRIITPLRPTNPL